MSTAHKVGHLSYLVGLARLQSRLNDFLAKDFPPGPKCVPWHKIINLQKAGTLPFCLALMKHYGNYSDAALCYTAAHGSYGLLWIAKHFIFPDPKWETRTTVLGQVWSFLTVLGPYWLAPWLLISRRVAEPSIGRCAAALGVYAVGVTAMMVSDAWARITLRYKPNQLVTDGPFHYVRHPNYLGEMLIYGSFAAMVPHWAPKAVLGFIWFQVFLPNMVLKEVSISRHKGFDEWYARTGMLLPPLRTLFSRSPPMKAA